MEIFRIKFLKKGKSYLKNFYRIISCFMVIFFAVFFALTLSGCGKKNVDTPAPAAERDYDLFVYNGDKTISKDFSEMCEVYTKKTGVVIKCVTPGKDDDATELLQNYMDTNLPPTIFSVNGMDDLKHWQSEGKIFDFSNANVENFKAITNNIPVPLRLTSNNVDNFGIPYTVEGYGLIYDPKMISSLFGGEYHRAILRDLEDCNFDDFENFVDAVKLYITEGRIYEFQLCGHSYSVLNKKSGLSQDLNGVFTSNYGDLNFSTGLFNIFLNRFFASAAYVRNASKSEISDIQPSLQNFLKMLSVFSSCVSGKNSTIYRSTELVDTKANSKTQAIKNFVAGNSLFLIGKTSDFEMISVLDSDLANRIDFIPLKSPSKKSSLDTLNEDSDANDFSSDSSSGTKATEESSAEKKMNASLATSVPMYFAINSTINETDLVKAQEFLAWMKTSDVAQDYFVNKFGFVPYDITDSRALNNSLNQSLVDFLKSTKILSYVADGLENKFRTETLPNYLIKNCLNNPLFDPYNQEISENILKMWNVN